MAHHRSCIHLADGYGCCGYTLMSAYQIKVRVFDSRLKSSGSEPPKSAVYLQDSLSKMPKHGLLNDRHMTKIM